MDRKTLLLKTMVGAAMCGVAAIAFPAVAQPQIGAAASAPPANAAASYREHIGNIVADENWYEVERRGYKAQRARPNFRVRTADDLTIYERRDLDRRGRLAQRARGARLPTQPVAHTPRVTYGNQYPGRPRLDAGLTNKGKRFAQGSRSSRVGQRVAGKAMHVASKASNLDLGAQMIGGRDIGATRFASDMTVGQLSNAFSGGDPIASAAHSTRRFGRNIEGGLIGIGQSIRDPRRIPRNVGRAVEGTGRAAVDTTRFVGETAVKTVRDSARMVTDPRFAAKQVNTAGRAVRNAGKSVCKGLSYLIPGANKKKCK